MSNDKQPALLTNTQRDYLDGEPVSQSYERNIRNQIQDRIEATMGDFAKLFSQLDDDDVRGAFGEKTAQIIKKDDDKLKEELSRADSISEIGDVGQDIPQPRKTASNAVFVIAFLLRGLNYENHDVYEHIEKLGEEQRAFSDMISVIESGIELYLKEEQNTFANVDVSIELSNIKPTYIEESESTD